ncbi:hypothetical protein DBR32_14495 [Taibaiella sp. KBW10]|uniref:LytR/AlgR family response regulator transcription factor n=1 Tax=Taibaiella sp. KBW10 TaxID=2153357 RepID=UPI000F592BDD|nr:LytTR family DNA-binding domain-containing protein [Taibaiella sp. KBW10]RQO29790.1 hypothetical protein DBR32_14495 [Taibaiella sp. KBW10]
MSEEKRTIPDIVIGIVDDEQASIDNIKGLLKYIYNNEQITILEATDFNSAVTLFNLKRVHILFLDISIGNKTGFEVLDKLGEQFADNIIIVSASEAHAYKSFNYKHVRHYLLKPITINEIKIAIEKCTLPDRVAAKENVDSAELRGHEGLSSEKDTIVIPNRNGFRIIKISEIAYLEANGSYCNILLTNGEKITHSRNMKFVSAELNESLGFIKVHKSYIVNKAQVVSYDSQSNLLTLYSGEKINVALPIRELLEYLQQ